MTTNQFRCPPPPLPPFLTFVPAVGVQCGSCDIRGCECLVRYGPDVVEKLEAILLDLNE